MPGVVVVVDAANVVGSRPDGWWRDRAGAARRLVESLRALPGSVTPAGEPWPDTPIERVVVVLEGAARAGVASGGSDGVEVVHAHGDGDDTLAELADGRSLVVTADRALAARVRARGAAVTGPRWLLDQL